MINMEKVIRHIVAEISIARTCKKDFASVDIDMLSDALALLKGQEAKVIEKAEDLYNEELYYMEIISHEPVNGMVPGKEHQLFPVVFYGFGIYHTVKNRCYIRVDAKNACKTTHLQSRWPMNGYGVWWRCWTKKPTEEQMRAVKWDDNI